MPVAAPHAVERAKVGAMMPPGHLRGEMDEPAATAMAAIFEEKKPTQPLRRRGE
jgi:hypothetical protein